MAAVPDDGKEPGARIAATIGFKIAIGAQERFLDNILCGIRIAAEETGKIIRRVKMGNDHVLKALHELMLHDRIGCRSDPIAARFFRDHEVE